MAKNTKTFGLIPNAYGLMFNNGLKRILFPPSRMAEGIAILLPRKMLKEEWETYYPEKKFSELEDAVMKKKGSRNLITRNGAFELNEGGTVVYGTIKGRRHGGRGDRNGNRTVVYNTMIKGLPMLGGEISDKFDVTCNCPDYLYHTGKDEFSNPRIACAHIGATLEAEFLKNDIPYLEDIVNQCKPLLEGEPVMPYNLHERMDLVTKTLNDRYIEGKKLYDIDVELLNEDIITPKFKEGIKDGYVTFNCSKDSENYGDSVNQKMSLVRSWLIDEGLERTGIAREFSGKCVWNFKIDDGRDLRLIPNIPENTVDILEVIYVGDMDYNTRKRFPKADYGLDPMRKKMRVGRLHHFRSYIKKPEVFAIINS